MKTKYIFASLLLSALTFVGCEEMDTFPEGDTVSSEQKNEIAEQDPSKAKARVNAIFSQFSQYMPNEGALGASRHNDIGYPSIMLFTDANGYDMVSDDNGYNWTGNSLDYTDRSQTSLECQMVWNDLYSMVFAANNVIAGFNAETTDATEQYYLAQGLGARAFAYWVMAQLYQYNYVGNESKPCVPLITEKNMEEAATIGAPRATVEAVYTQITTDLSSAIALLQSAAKSKVTRGTDKRYISLGVAYGLSARTYLAMHKYAEAAAAASNAITESKSEGLQPSNLLSGNKPAFWNIEETNWMWGIVVNETDDVVSSGIVNWPSHMGSLNYGYANFSKGRMINKKLYDTIKDGDARKSWWLATDLKPHDKSYLTDAQQKFVAAKGYGAYTQVKFSSYNNVVGNSINANDIPLMRIEEMYLIKAEGEAMSGGNGKKTLEDFVKAYRYKDYSCTAVTPEDIQEEVFLQRRIELWGEGLNWFDLMRLKKSIDRRGGGFPNANMVFNIASDDPILLWPIPEVELQANQALSSNDQNKPGTTPKAVTDN